MRFLKKLALQIEVKSLLKDNKKNLDIILKDLKTLEELQNSPEYAKQADNWREKFLQLKEKRLIQRERLISLQKRVFEL